MSVYDNTRLHSLQVHNLGEIHDMKAWLLNDKSCGIYRDISVAEVDCFVETRRKVSDPHSILQSEECIFSLQICEYI